MTKTLKQTKYFTKIMPTFDQHSLDGVVQAQKGFLARSHEIKRPLTSNSWFPLCSAQNPNITITVLKIYFYHYLKQF